MFIIKNISCIIIAMFVSTLATSANAEDKIGIEPELKSDVFTFQKITREFANSIYILGERTGGSPTEWDEVERSAIEQLRASIVSVPTQLLKTEDSQTQSPLITASSNGHYVLVAELLTHSVVRKHINDLDVNGLSALDHSLLAIRQTLFACHPDAMENPFALVPIVVTQPYYRDRNPYVEIFNALIKDGALLDTNRARDYWLRTCIKASVSVRDIVNNSVDLQNDLIALGQETLANGTEKQQREKHARTKEIEALLREFEEGKRAKKEKLEEAIKKQNIRPITEN